MVVQHEQLVDAQREHRVRAPLIVAELDLEHIGAGLLNSGANLAPQKPGHRQIGK
jgi:hypothetical protein